MSRIPLPADIVAEMRTLVRIAPYTLKVLAPGLVLIGVSDVLRLLPQYLPLIKVDAGNPHQVDLLFSPQGPRNNEPPIVLRGVRGVHTPRLVDT